MIKLLEKIILPHVVEFTINIFDRATKLSAALAISKSVLSVTFVIVRQRIWFSSTYDFWRYSYEITEKEFVKRASSYSTAKLRIA